MKSNIILGDSDLGRNLNSLLPQIVDVLDSVNKWQLVVEPWLQLSLELLEPVKKQSILFWDNDGDAKVLPIVLANPL
jgi:hypothetical protein